MITDYVTMNTTYGSKGEGIKNHSCFNGNSGVGVRTRQAVNYVVNRPAALAQRGAFAGTPTDQVLPPTMPGFKNWKLYPTGKPNAAKANSLKPKKCGSTVFYGSTSPVSVAIMQLVKADLSKIGINTTLKTFPFAVRIAKEGHRGEPFDLDLQAWGADYPDPVDFIDILLDGRNIQAENNNNNAYFNHTRPEQPDDCRWSYLEPAEALRGMGPDRPRHHEERRLLWRLSSSGQSASSLRSVWVAGLTSRSTAQ